MENVLNINLNNYNAISIGSDEGHPSQIRLNISNCKDGYVEFYEGCEFQKIVRVNNSPHVVSIESKSIIRFRCVDSSGNKYPFINILENKKEITSEIQLEEKTNNVFMFREVNQIINLFALNDGDALIIGDDALIV